MDPRQKIPGPDHPISMELNPTRITVRVAGRLVADTTSALTLREAAYPPVHYIPLADIDQTLLRPSASHTYCPYKGECTYFNVAILDNGGHLTTEVADAVWTYDNPYPGVARIAAHAAFYPDRVDISIDRPSKP
jgi:uncharacterized protein (DUF427 family)